VEEEVEERSERGRGRWKEEEVEKGRGRWGG